MFHKRRLRLLSVEVPRVNSNIGQILFTIHYISILQKLLFFFFLLFFLETKSVTRSLPHSVTHGDQVHWCDCHFTQASRWGKAAILRLDKIHGRRQPWCPGWSSASRWCSLWVASNRYALKAARSVWDKWCHCEKGKKRGKKNPNEKQSQTSPFSRMPHLVYKPFQEDNILKSLSWFLRMQAPIVYTTSSCTQAGIKWRLSDSLETFYSGSDSSQSRVLQKEKKKSRVLLVTYAKDQVTGTRYLFTSKHIEKCSPWTEHYKSQITWV